MTEKEEDKGISLHSQELHCGQKKRWPMRPWPLLLLAGAAQLAVFAAQSVLLWVFAYGASGGAARAAEATAVSQAANALIAASAACAFYFPVKSAQGACGAASPAWRKTGAPFWLCLALALAYFALSEKDSLAFPYIIAAPSEIAAELAGALLPLSVFCLIFPVLEGRFGVIRSTLCLCAFTIVMSLLGNALDGVNVLLLAAVKSGQPLAATLLSVFSAGLYRFIAYAALSAAAAALGLAAMRAALFKVARSRAPVALLLFVSVPGLLSQAYHFLAALLPSPAVHPAMRVLMQYGVLDYTYDLLVFGAAVFILARNRRPNVKKEKEI